MQDGEPVPISAINQWAFCPRRCGLIHVEAQFADNLHTVRGTAEHAQVDRVSYVTSKSGVTVEYALPAWSDHLGLVGRCDAVEFWEDGTVYPIEYKHGLKRRWLNDDLQIAAQALCLEEMFGRPVVRGAIFHMRSHRRREVNITSDLRTLVERAIAAIRAMLDTGRVPPPINYNHCRECSLHEICQPEATVYETHRQKTLIQLFDPDVP